MATFPIIPQSPALRDDLCGAAKRGGVLADPPRFGSRVERSLRESDTAAAPGRQHDTRDANGEERRHGCPEPER